MNPIRVLLCIALVANAESAVAQSGPDGQALGAWYDSLTSAPADALPQFEARSREGTGDVGRVRRALYQVVLASARDDLNTVSDVLLRLESVAEAHRSWAWPSLAMALGYARLAREHAPALTLEPQFEGEGNVDATWRWLDQSVRADPTNAAIARLAASLMLPGGDRFLTDRESDLLERLLSFHPNQSDLLLIRARDRRSHLRYNDALILFRRADSQGGDHSLLALEIARTLRALGDSAGAISAYWDGVSHLTPVGRELYRFDLAWILPPDSIAAFDKVPDDSVHLWLQRFWGERDAAAVLEPGGRLAEHLRRWVFVHRDYRVDRPWRYSQMPHVPLLFEPIMPCISSNQKLYDELAREAPTHAGDLREHEPLLDHRGLIYLRHGPPWRTQSEAVALLALKDVEGRTGVDPVAASEQRGPGNRVAESDTWLYWFEGEWRLLHFRGSDALGQYRPSTLSSIGPEDPRDLEMLAEFADVVPGLGETVHRLIGQSMSQIARHRPSSCLDEVRETILKLRGDAAVAANSDTDTPIITHPWPSSIGMFALGHGSEGNGKVLVTFAFGTNTLQGTATSTGYVTPIRLRIVAFDRASGRTVSLDTLREFVSPDRPAANTSLTGWAELPLPGGSWQVALRADQNADSSGAYTLRRDVTVDTTGGLALSDVVTGFAGVSNWTATDGETFPVNVLDMWPRGGTAQLFYEVRGVRAGESYRTTVAVTPADDPRHPVVRVETADRATGQVSYVRRALGLQRLKPGSYHVTVTVSKGQVSASRTTRILVQQR